MPFGKRLLPVLLALIWAPLVMHCQLESVTGWNLFSCETASHTQDSPAHCEDETCMDVESGLYQLPTNQTFIALVFLAVLVPALAQLSFKPTETSREVEELPTDFPRPWQFFFRTALPARAPSAIA